MKKKNLYNPLRAFCCNCGNVIRLTEKEANILGNPPFKLSYLSSLERLINCCTKPTYWTSRLMDDINREEEYTAFFGYTETSHKKGRRLSKEERRRIIALLL